MHLNTWAQLVTVLGNHRIFGLAGRHNSGLFEDSRVALCFWIVPHNKLLLPWIQPCLCHRTDLSLSTVLPLSASVCHFVIATRKITDSSTCQRTWREISVQVEALAKVLMAFTLMTFLALKRYIPHMHALFILLLGPKIQQLVHQTPICLWELQMEIESTSRSDFLIIEFPKLGTHRPKA